jgi:hypothetical protein
MPIWPGASSVSTATAKNAIIGGDFTTNPWQRGTTFTGVGSGDYTADRFATYDTSAAVWDVLKTADAPTAAEASLYTAHCLHADITTADASIAAGDITGLQHKVEGLNAARFGFGQAGTRNVTLSFWHKHTKTGTHCVALGNSAANRSYIAEYTQSVTDTWEKAEITIPVDTSGTWLYTNGVGVIAYFAMACGSTFQTTAGSWAAGNYLGSSNQVNNLDNVANNFKIALVQLEEGSTATDFDAIRQDEVEAACRRYTRVDTFFVPATTAQNLGVIDMRATPTITGGGGGFNSTGTTANSLIAFQTSGAATALTLAAEL